MTAACAAITDNNAAHKHTTGGRLADTPVQTLCIAAVSLHSPDFVLESSQFRTDFLHLLENSGFSIVSGGGSCDATLAMELDGSAYKRKYTVRAYRYGKDRLPVPMPGRGYTRECYGTAGVKGALRVSGPGIESFSVPVGGGYTAYVADEDRCLDPAGAPFREAWVAAILDGLTSLWGLRTLIDAMAMDDYAVGYAAVARVQGNFAAGGPFVGYTLTERDIQKLTFALDTGKESLMASHALELLKKMGPAAIDVVPAILRFGERLKPGDLGLYRDLTKDALRSITQQEFETLDGWRQWWNAR